MTHGGERQGAGRPSVPLDEKRMMHLINQGVSRREIGKRFGVAADVIAKRVLKLKNG